MKLLNSLLVLGATVTAQVGPGDVGHNRPDFIETQEEDGKARPKPGFFPNKNKPTRKPVKAVNKPNKAQNNKPYYKPTTKKPVYTTKPTTTKYTPTTKRDVNECYLGTDRCHYNARCINTIGSYQCVCNPGYTGNGYRCKAVDENECKMGTHQCDEYAQCVNTIGSYTCNCVEGYEGDGYKCQPEKVDECATGAHNCSRYADCIDKYWGFKCRCQSGYDGDGVTCTAKVQDPCANNRCHNMASCIAGKYGGYTCECPSGYAGRGMGNNGCVDIDECYDGGHACDVTASCLNSQGSYSCACAEGYSGNGYSCESDDVDECALGTHQCATGATCTNTFTGYDCACPSGWSGDGMTCTEDYPNGCSAYNPCADKATCMDTTDGPECMCGSGYSGNGRMTAEERARKNGNRNKNKNKNTNNYGSDPYASDSGYSGSSGSSYDMAQTTTEPYTTGEPMGAYGSSGDGCADIDECAGCSGGGAYAFCPCSDPTPICSNTDGGYTCGIDTAFGDPHFRVTAPGEDPVCFDLDTPSGAIIDLYSDAKTSLEVNAMFKNVHNGKKQFIKAIGFTSAKGLQVAVTPTSVEVYENGEEFKVYNIETEHVDERMFDVRMIVKPAEHELHHNRHTVDIIQEDGTKFRFAVKPGAGSLSFELEGNHGMKAPTGIIGQFTNPGAYTVDEGNNIKTEFVRIPSAERAWHSEHQCHQINSKHVEAFLGRAITDYQVTQIFESLFYRAPVATLHDDTDPK